MRPIDDGDVIAVRDDVEARVLVGTEGVEEAVSLLDEAESVAAVPLVDEAERARLEALAAGREDRATHWRSVLARRTGEPVGYAGVLLPHDPGGLAAGDVAVARHRAPLAPTLSVLLASLEGLAWWHRSGRLQVWLRHATAPDVACATGEGFDIERRLGVLGRTLDHVDVVPPPPDITVRAYRPDADDAAVVDVLASAYAGTPETGWTTERLEEKRRFGWFRAEDLLVAEQEDGSLAGLHWLKRRGPSAGEVYNLAIHPRGQGRGLGAVLLTAGLAHLAAAGLEEVVLWVDLANDRAVRLYASQGFATRWEDIALTRTLRGGR